MTQGFGTELAVIPVRQQTQPRQVPELVDVQTSFLKYFSELEDSRVERTRAHLMIDICEFRIF